MSWPAIGVREHQDFKISRQLLDGGAKVADFFAAVFGSAGKNNVSFSAGLAGHALHEAGGRVGLRCQREENFVILMVEFAQCGEVLFKARFHTLAGAEHRSAWRVKSRIDGGTTLRVTEPEHSLIDQIKAHQNLQQAKENKKIF